VSPPPGCLGFCHFVYFSSHTKKSNMQSLIAIGLCAVIFTPAVALPRVEDGIPPTDKFDYFTLKQHHVFRRSAGETDDARHFSKFELPIRAFGRQFNLHLDRAQIFSANATIQGKPVTDFGYYQGQVMGAPKSFVHVHINKDSGDVTGRFWEHPDLETFIIRPTEENGKHMIYSETVPESEKLAGTCGVNNKKNEQTSRNRRAVSASTWTVAKNQQTIAGAVTRNETTCEMALFADGDFVSTYGKDKIVSIMIERMAAAQVVMDNGNDATNGAQTDFYDWKGVMGQVRVVLKIKWLDFYIDEASSSEDAKTINELVKDQTDTKIYLEKFSEFDWSPYCLAHAFTYKDFSGTLGLAFTAYPKGQNQNGGICQARYNDGTKGPTSINTGWHSSLNFGNKQLEAQSALVLAHEIGHNFGAQHDPETTAVTASGNYVMYKFAVSGAKSNNKKFSPESVTTMGETMRDRAGCFVNVSEPTCGNGIIEEGEHCDCGSSDVTECNRRDACCKPSDCFSFKNNGTGACSPKDPAMGGCCDGCTLYPAGDAVSCGVETECKKAGVCTDNAVKPCSSGVSKTDGTFCEVGLSLGDTGMSTSVCDAGECTQSLCTFLGLSECDTIQFGEDNGCLEHCKDTDGVCKLLSTITVASKSAINGAGTSVPLNSATLATLKRAPGATCENIEGQELSGVCDADGKCLAADTEEDTLAELKRQYEQFKDTFVTWVSESTAGVPRYVWLIIGGVILIILCCGGCYVANKDEVLEQKKKMGRRMSGKRKNRGNGAQGI